MSIKKQLCALLSTGLLFSMFTVPMTVNADSDGIVYEEEEGFKMITGYNGSGGDVVIPSTENVVKINYGAFTGNTKITSVTIPDSVWIIDEGAFLNCTSLKKINIGSGVVTNYAGAYPDGPFTLEGVFDGCPALEEITVSEENIKFSSVDGVLYNKDKTSLEFYPAAKIGDTYEIPASVTSVAAGAFQDNKSLKAIEVESGNTAYSAADGVLFNNNKSELIVCPKGKTGAYTVPASVKEIKGSAFAGCTELTDVVLHNGITNILGDAFKNCTGLTDMSLPGSLESVYVSVFEGCTGLQNVTIGNGPTIINSKAFAGCTSLKNVTIPSSVTRISYTNDNSNSFFGCSGVVITYNGSNDEFLGKLDAIREQGRISAVVTSAPVVPESHGDKPAFAAYPDNANDGGATGFVTKLNTTNENGTASVINSITWTVTSTNQGTKSFTKVYDDPMTVSGAGDTYITFIVSGLYDDNATVVTSIN